MNGWERIPLGDLYEVHNGLSKGSKFFGHGYPFLSFSTVFNNFFVPKTLSDLVQSTDAERDNYSILRGDVFITRTSETSDELGMSCVALKDYPNATYNGFTKRMRPKTDKVLPEYIGYYLRMPSFRNGFQAFSAMSTRASLRNEDLLSMVVKLPSIYIQTRIASTLLAYDNLIENNQKQIKLLEEAAQRLYKEWFEKKNHEITSKKHSFRKIKLGEIAPFVRGKTITSSEVIEGNVPVVAGGLEPAYYHNIANTKAPVITVSGSGANAGFTNLYYEDIWASDCSFVDVESTKYPYYVFCFLKRNKAVLDNLQKGAAQPHVYAKDLNNIDLMLPDEIMLEQFEETVSPIFKKIKCSLAEIKHLKEARDRLLPKLMNGEIEL